jgi:opacity protein-like surface antigen
MAFKNNSSNSFAYQLGTGIRLEISKNWDASATYEYIDLGKIHLGEGAVRPGVKGPEIQLTSNAFLLGLTYKF